MLHGITLSGLFPWIYLTVRNELSIRMVFAPTMIASYAARVSWSKISVSCAMYFIRIFEEAPFFRVSFPSAVISDIIRTCGRSVFCVIGSLLTGIIGWET
jgi:hypothetical protein